LHLKSYKISKCSKGVSKSNNTSFYRQTPVNYLTSSNVLPKILTVPMVGSSTPVNNYTVDVFPDPPCPNNTKISPA
jgi:hypothetical protein